MWNNINTVAEELVSSENIAIFLMAGMGSYTLILFLWMIPSAFSQSTVEQLEVTQER